MEDEQFPPPEATVLARYPASHPFVQQLLGHSEGLEIPSLGDFSDVVAEFVNSVNWHEPWLVALMSFHVLTFVVLVATRHRHEFQVGLFLTLIVLAFLGEALNDLGQVHWRTFASTNYFDQSGFFVTIVYGLPLVINSVLALFFMMIRTVSMLVKVKRAQLRSQQAAATASTTRPIATSTTETKKSQ